MCVPTRNLKEPSQGLGKSAVLIKIVFARSGLHICLTLDRTLGLLSWKVKTAADHSHVRPTYIYAVVWKIWMKVWSYFLLESLVNLYFSFLHFPPFDTASIFSLQENFIYRYIILVKKVKKHNDTFIIL